MEKSSLSSHRTTLKDHLEEQEESGWTTYLKDFSEHRSSSYSQQHTSFGPSFSTGTSLVSDAASRYHDRANSSHRSPPNQFNHMADPKKLSLSRKIRTKKIAEEDPLEDTASSPVSSPTGSGFEMKSKDRRDDQTGSKGQNGDSCASLKNRRLCSVPLSLFSNYVG